MSSFASASNIAPDAQVSASSTFCSGSNPSLHCYDARRANDGNTSTNLGGFASWANGNTSLPQWWQAAWDQRVRINSVTIHTSEGYPIQNYDLQYFDESTSAWETIDSVRGNTSLTIHSSFSTVYTKKFRVLGLKGPNRQTVYVRLNEVIINGEILNNNIAPLATASASTTFCSGENPSLHCYDAARVNDGITDTALGGYTSWANNRNSSLPQWWQATWNGITRVDSATVYTSEGYPIQDFDLQYFNLYTGAWQTLKEVRGNTQLSIGLSFNHVYTNKVRVVGYRGPNRQTVYVRLNEVVINGQTF